jgi:hypothetical protein
VKTFKLYNFMGYLKSHICNPSYSGDRDQKDHSLRPAWANSSRDPILKKTSQKRAGGVAQGVGSEFKPQYHTHTTHTHTHTHTHTKSERETARPTMLWYLPIVSQLAVFF